MFFLDTNDFKIQMHSENSKGEEFDVFIPTEWDMEESFDCQCMSPQCLAVKSKEPGIWVESIIHANIVLQITSRED